MTTSIYRFNNTIGIADDVHISEKVFQTLNVESIAKQCLETLLATRPFIRREFARPRVSHAAFVDAEGNYVLVFTTVDDNKRVVTWQVTKT